MHKIFRNKWQFKSHHEHNSPRYECLHNAIFCWLVIFRLGHAEVQRLCWQRANSLFLLSFSMENTKKSYELHSFYNIWRMGIDDSHSIICTYEYDIYVLFQYISIILSFQRKHKSLEKKNYEIYMKVITPKEKIDNFLDALDLVLSYQSRLASK